MAEAVVVDVEVVLNSVYALVLENTFSLVNSEVVVVVIGVVVVLLVVEAVVVVLFGLGSIQTPFL